LLPDLKLLCFIQPKGKEINMEAFNKLKEAVEAAASLVEKTDKGNKSAGTKLRKAMQEVRKLAKSVRDDVLTLREAQEAQKNATPTDSQ